MGSGRTLVHLHEPTYRQHDAAPHNGQ